MSKQLVNQYGYLHHSEPLQKESSREVWARMLNQAWVHMKENHPEPGHTTVIEMTDGPRYSSELPQKIIAGWRDAVICAKDKEVHELNDMEKFAIAYFSGVPVEFVCDPQRHPLDPENPPDGPRMRWRTKVKVGFVKDRGKFIVYQMGT